MRDRASNHRSAAEKFVQRMMSDPQVIGIIVAGSVQYATIDKHSDVDIYIVLDPSCLFRERGNTWIDGIEIEYFKNPPQQIRSYFKNEDDSPHTADMLANGHVALCRSQEVKDLISEAKQILSKLPPKLTPAQIELAKYLIDDQFKDFDDSIDNDNKVGAIIMRHKMLNTCIDIFCQVHQIRRDKDKRVHHQIATIAPTYLDSIASALTEDWNLSACLREIKHMTEGLLGGPRALEWKLKSNLNL